MIRGYWSAHAKCSQAIACDTQSTPRHSRLRPTLRRIAILIVLPMISMSASADRPTIRAALAAGLVPSPPSLTAAVSPGEIRLQWTHSSRAHSYRIFEKRGTETRLRQVGSRLPPWISGKRIALSAHLHAWERSSYVVEACNWAGCVASGPVVPAGAFEDAVATVTSEYEFHEPTGGPRNQAFGTQVALSGDGNTLAVSDIWYFGGGEWPWYGSGAVYVYARRGGQWIVEAKLEPPDPRGYDFFGSDLALNERGDTLAVGAQYEGYDAPSQDAGPGAVFVFARRAGSWAQQAALQAGEPEDAASFGRSVEISRSGDTLAVGAPYQSAGSASIPEAGAVYVFERRDGAWSQQAHVNAPNPEPHDLFGLGVRLSDNGRTVAVLAGEQNWATEDYELGGWGGRFNTVYLFSRSEQAWDLHAEIEGSADDPMLGGYGYDYEGQIEGFDLSANGRTLAIASPFAAASDQAAGLIRVYENKSGVWTPGQAALTPSIADRRTFGLRLSLSGNGRTLVATAERNEGPYGQPFVVAFTRRGNRWIEASALESPAWPDYTSFGNSLALSTNGKRLAIGAQRYTIGDSYWGAVFVY